MLKANRNIKGNIFNIQKFSLNDGPGIRTNVFFKGCPLGCKWCSNPESQFFLNDEEVIAKIDDKENLKGKIYTVDEILKEVEKDRVFYEDSGGGITLSGGECLSQPEFAKNILMAAKEDDINTAIETAGYVKEDMFMSIMDYVDHFLFDIKHWDKDKHKKYTGVSNELILKNFTNAKNNNKDILARIPVIPGFNDSLDDAKNISKLLNKLGQESCQLLPFHQFGEKKYALLEREYEYEGVDSLHKEDLIDYQNTMRDNGIEAFF